MKRLIIKFSRVVGWVAVALIATYCSKHDEGQDPAPSIGKRDSVHTNQNPSQTPSPSTAPQGLLELKILPQETDSGIAESPEPHYVYLDKSKSQNGLLLLFLAGTNSFPKHYLQFSKAAAALGYHVINLNYPNTISGRIACGDQGLNCFGDYHEEMISGKPVSDVIDVDVPNAIQNRVFRLLQYLDKKNPSDGWSQFYNGEAPEYSKYVVAGHSQGGSHAAYIGYKFKVNRVIIFNAPYDYYETLKKSASWCTATSATPADSFYGLMHERDEIVPPLLQYSVWKDMNMLNHSDTVSADRAGFEKAKALYTNIDPNPNAQTRLKHNSAIADDALPADASGDQIKKVWNYFLAQ